MIPTGHTMDGMWKATALSTAVAAWLAGAALAQANLLPDQNPLTVTTDTSEYCLGLADRMDADADMPAHARVLWHSGRALCEHGHVRAGLVRLRRAMRMLRESPGGSPQAGSP